MSIHKSLNKIQSELNCPKAQRNDFGNYNYRSCEDIIEAAKPLLHAEGLILLLTDEIVNVGNRNYIEATASITDGDNTIAVKGIAREAENRKGMDDSQITGATSSYARKYALNGLFAIDDTKDADTMKPKKEESQKKQADLVNGNDSSLEVFFIAIAALETKDSAHQWKRNNQESIDSLGADKGKVMNKYLSKVKELK
jgi:hypothetical protein